MLALEDCYMPLFERAKYRSVSAWIVTQTGEGKRKNTGLIHVFLYSAINHIGRSGGLIAAII